MRLSKRNLTTLTMIFVPAITAGVFFAYPLNNVKAVSNQENFRMPHEVKAVYLTSWSASSDNYIKYVIDLTEETEINSVVVDIKDWSGKVFYDTDVPIFEKYNAERVFLSDIESLIERLHEKDIGVIARIVVFQDPVLAKKRLDLAIKSKTEGKEFWETDSGLAWVDPASKEVWNYNVRLAQDAFQKGFDEVNFDYVRFPSDGNLEDAKYPVWNSKNSKDKVIEKFFRYVRNSLPHKRLSVDLFGLTTINPDNLGVGQIIESAFQYFDYVCPMVYPSHFAKGSLGFENPAEHPYQIVFRSIVRAKSRLEKVELQKKRDIVKFTPWLQKISYIYPETYSNEERLNFQKLKGNPYQEVFLSMIESSSRLREIRLRNLKIESKLRPWLQDFDLGVDYTPKMVENQIKATSDALGESFTGFMLWSPTNIYSEKALKESSEQ